jgi:acetylglutamate kinase
MKETNMSNADRAGALIDALPYIQAFRGRTVVVKYGGNAMINEALKTAVIQDLIFMQRVGIRTVLVHGGGPEIDSMLNAVGKESRFVQGLRYTDQETMEIVQMVLCGGVNKDITALIQQEGGMALGLSGIDGALLQGHLLKTTGEDLGFVGEIETVNTSALESLLDSGIIPVVSSVALGIGDAAGHSLNVNADTAAAKIAAAMAAEKLVLMTDVRGILRNVHDPDSLITELKHSELEGLISDGIVNKGMIPKVECCSLALNGGVKRAHIIDGRLPHALLIELFTGEGIGTMIVEN